MSRRTWVALAIAGSLLARPDAVRFLRWTEIQPLIASLVAAGEKLPEFPKASDWDTWIRQRDFDVRVRSDRAVENSISG